MRKFRKVLTLCMAVFMVMQVVLPTISQAVQLNIQYERPYNDDDGDGTVENDIYRLMLKGQEPTADGQAIFKIGEQTGVENEKPVLKFDEAYYCLRGDLGFGSNDTILKEGLEYSKIADLSDKDTVMSYFKNTIYDMPEANYNSIYWIVDNMYLPNSEYKEEMKADLLKKAGIISDLLTDDDIEVVQQIALWYFTNHDKYDEDYSVSLADNKDLANLLKINNYQHTDSENDSFNEDRAEDINTLYRYFVDNAKANSTQIVENVPQKLELDKTLNPTIETKTLPSPTLDAFIVGPFKINKIQEGNTEGTFSYTLKYKTSETQTEWSTIEIENEGGTVVLSNANGIALDRTKNVEDMIAGDEFYITILKDISGVSNIAEFQLEISYDTHYYITTAELLAATVEYQQPVLKVEKEKQDPQTDLVTVKPEQKIFDLALRKFISGINRNGNNIDIDSREPKVYTDTLKNGTFNRDGKFEHTATYEHSKKPLTVKIGDTIIYTIRVYNEGDLNGYATEVTDYLFDGLEFIEDSDLNKKYSWVLAEDGKTLTTNYLADKELKAYNPEMRQELVGRDELWQKSEDGTDGLYYADLQIECKIKETSNLKEVIPNVAAITGATPEKDRDSKPEDLKEDELREYDDRIQIVNDDEYKSIQDDDDYERVVIEPEKVFDLALRKYITKINGDVVTNTRNPQVDIEPLKNLLSTADYNHRKEPLEVKTGDLVTYKLTIYNEGDIAGRATKVVDQLPTGLEFVEVKSGNYELESYDVNLNKITLKEKQNNADLAARKEGELPSSTTIELVCKVTAKVKQNNQILTNVAWISEDYNTENEPDRDSNPSTPPDVNKDNMSDYTGKDNKEDLTDSENYYKGQEDDDDFEKLVIKGKEFDLSLRKYISNIERKGQKVDFSSRVPGVDTTPLTQNKTTANYIHPKDALTVKQGDIITYKLRVYNEGELDGYATEITDYIPEGLGLFYKNEGYILDNSGNSNWLIGQNFDKKPLVGETGFYKTIDDVPESKILEGQDLSSISIVTGKDGVLEIRDSLSLKEALIKKYGSEVEEGDLYQQSVNSENDGLFYQEIEVTCIVLAPNTYEGIITNIAEISEDKAVEITVNENDEKIETEVDVPDRDSKTGNVLEDEKHTPGAEKDGYTPGEQDDDDFEPVQLKYFDLALRKFITGVNDKKVDTRIPEFYIDEEGNYKYKHDKTPVEVVDNDNVTYTIRVFNEGTIAGYAEEIEDDIPEGLIFLPDDETNKQYGWKMYYYDEEGTLVETDKVEEATVIRTTYLSEQNGELVEETGKNSNLLEIFDKETMEQPDFRDVKVVFKVSQKDIPAENEDGIITNKAHITDDSDDDEDSTPDEWNEGEDDQDTEKVYVQKFDLALFKWVTQTIVTVDGKTTTTETGFKPNIGKTEASGDDYRENTEKEPIAAVTIDKKKLNSTVVKFVYNIKVVNEGDIPGYAAEITDYIPAGLKFVAEDNPLWTLGDEGKITTRALETKLLNPGESAEVPVTFTWINDANNLGQKINIAAITEDCNEKGVPDEDSTPGNEDIPNYEEKEQEDDDDFALVILTLKTGNAVSYIWLIFVVTAIILAGAISIKKYVL